MRKSVNKLLSIVLALVMLFGISSVNGLVAQKASADAVYKTGDFIEFGSYPQSEITDSATLSALNSLISAYSWENDWISYKYYSGNNEFGTGVQGDWMRYVDVTYNDDIYRAVKFTQYRPSATDHLSDPDSTRQNKNGYYPNNVYWFKFEPIKWRILDPQKGLLMAELCVDSQSYRSVYYWDGVERWGNEEHTIYANDYVTSSIRKWLNEDFYNTAFSDVQKTQLVRTALDNSSPFREGMYSAASTNDMVFLPSFYDVTNPDYGFSSDVVGLDSARLTKSTDYADIQGIFNAAPGEKTNSFWYLRSPGFNGNCACYVHMDSYSYTEIYVDYTYVGVRPAVTLDLTTLHTHNEAAEYSFDAQGHWNACSDCKTKLNFEKHIPGEPATEDTPQVCTVCGYEIAPALSHVHSWEKVYSTDESSHWYACSECNARKDCEEHIPGAPSTKTSPQVCTVCGYELVPILSHAHSFTDEYCKDETYHWKECTECGMKMGYEMHLPGDYTEDGAAQLCRVCGYEIFPAINPTSTLVGIEIFSEPTTKELRYKSNASTDGLKVLAKYSDGVKVRVTDKAKISNFSANNKQGTYTATVEYEGFTATFNYTVRYAWWQWIIRILLLGIFWY